MTKYIEMSVDKNMVCLVKVTACMIDEVQRRELVQMTGAGQHD